jgi:hypothetical protein
MKKIVKLIGISIKRKQTKNYQNTMFKKYPKLNCLDNSIIEERIRMVMNPKHYKCLGGPSNI